MAGYTVGIDVGTTFTAAATCQDGRTEVATLGDRSDVIPSVAFLREDGMLLVGHAAERRAVADATRVARAFKRRIGDGVPLWLGEEARTAEALTAAVVRWVVDLVATRAGGAPDRTVLTYPASWGEHRRGLLLAAAAEAGVGDAELVPEPVAAALHYATRQGLPTGELVGVYDLGGGTFDATVLRRTDAGFETVGQPQGDDHLGGIDFDALVWDHVLGVLGPDAVEVGDDPSPRALRALAQLRAETVDAKEALSYDTQAVVPVALPDLMTEVRITRAEFEELARAALLRTIDVFRRTCASADAAPADLHAVLLVGGSSRIPMISQLVGRELGAPVAMDAHPKLATCFGAALAAAAGHPPVARPPVPHPTPPVRAPEPAPATAPTRQPVVLREPPSPAPPAPPAPHPEHTEHPEPHAREPVTEPPPATAAPARVDTVVRPDRQEPLVAHIGRDGDPPGVARRAVTVVALVVLVVAVAVGVVSLTGDDGSPAGGGERPTTTPTAAP